MKLTKKQKQEMYNNYAGIGDIIISLGENKFVSASIHLGRNDKWYRGEVELGVWLQEIKNEIIQQSEV